MDEINVWLVSEYFYPVISGAGERFRRYAPGLKKRGINLNVATVYLGSEIQNERLVDIPVVKFPVAKLSNRQSGTGSVSDELIKKTYQYVLRSGNKIDCSHFLNHAAKSSLKILRFQSLGIPCVSSVTMMPGRSSSSFGSVKLAVRQWIRYFPFIKIIVLSNEMASRMHEYGITQNRIKIIPNGVDLQRFSPPRSLEEKNNLRKKLNLDIDAEIILFVGHIIPRKGVDLLAASWTQISTERAKSQLLLVGAHKDESMTSDNGHAYFDKVKKLINDSGSADKVSVINEVDNIEEYMRAADLFVFPSRQEGNPNVVMEAMACGLPCIMTPFDGLSSELGEDERDYYVVPFSVDSIAEKAIALLADTPERQRMSKACSEFARNNFGLERTLDEYASMYRNVVNNK